VLEGDAEALDQALADGKAGGLAPPNVLLLDGLDASPFP